MTDFSTRLQMYRNANMITESDIKDVYAVIDMFKDKYGIELAEENAGTFIAHLCMAFMRNKTNEKVLPLEEKNIEELSALDSFPLSKEVLSQIEQIISNPLSEAEEGYILLHLNNLIQQLIDSGSWNQTR